MRNEGRGNFVRLVQCRELNVAESSPLMRVTDIGQASVEIMWSGIPGAAGYKLRARWRPRNGLDSGLPLATFWPRRGRGLHLHTKR